MARRAISFARDRLIPLRRELAGYALPGATQGWPPERTATLTQARRRLEGLEAALGRAERALAQHLPPDLDLPGLPAAVREVEGLVTALRGGQARPVPQARPPAARPPAPRPPATPLPGSRPGTGAPPEPGPGTPAPTRPQEAGLLGLLRSLATPQRVTAPAPVAAPPPDPLAGPRRALEGAWSFLVETLRYVGPRLGVVEAGLQATGLPGKRRTWAEATEAVLEVADTGQVDPAHLGWLPPLVRLFWGTPVAVREAHGALVHWHEAEALQGQARAALDEMTQAPRGQVAELLAANPVTRLRGVAFPLSHLHVRFKGHPPLDLIFPAPKPGAPAARPQTRTGKP